MCVCVHGVHGVCACACRCGVRVSAGTLPAEEQGESDEGSESKTLQHEAGGGDQPEIRGTKSPGTYTYTHTYTCALTHAHTYTHTLTHILNS